MKIEQAVKNITQEEMILLMKKNRTRLIVRRGDENVALRLEEIAFIYRDNALVIVVDKQQKKYFSGKNLMQLENELDPAMFFRVNRKYILSINSIRSYRSVDKVKLEVNLNFNEPNHQIIVSQETAPVFKKWISEEL